VVVGVLAEVVAQVLVVAPGILVVIMLEYCAMGMGYSLRRTAIH
jgi:hypothetical protein